MIFKMHIFKKVPSPDRVIPFLMFLSSKEFTDSTLEEVKEEARTYPSEIFTVLMTDSNGNVFTT